MIGALVWILVAAVCYAATCALATLVAASGAGRGRHPMGVRLLGALALGTVRGVSRVRRQTKTSGGDGRA